MGMPWECRGNAVSCMGKLEVSGKINVLPLRGVCGVSER